MPYAIPEPDLPSLVAHEAARLEALHRYDVLDTAPEMAFDRITRLAARLFNAPTALIALGDESRVWFKSSYGSELTEMPRTLTLDGSALLPDQVEVILDASQDERGANHPLVQDKAGQRFYAGAPLLTAEGFSLGSLCVLDSQPREAFTTEQQLLLGDLAAMVVDELELRLAARKITEIDRALLTVTQGVSNCTGGAYFQALVRHFAAALGVAYAYIGVLEDNPQGSIQTLAVCAEGHIVDNFDYLLINCPCERVIESHDLCCYPSGVRSQFPGAPLLASLGIDSYAAVAFYDSQGAALGLLGIMDRKPLTNLYLTQALLPTFALRVATELERQKTDAAHQQTQQHLEQLVAQRTAELSQTNRRLQLEIAERQQAEIALKKEQEMQRVLLENVQAGIVACDETGILTLFNQAARNFHGLPEQPLPPDQWADYYDLYQSDGKTRLTQAEIPLFRALQGESVVNAEMVIAPRGGKARTVLSSGRAIAIDEGRSHGAVVVMHDITDRKRAEEERAQLILEQAARLEAEAANRIKDEFLAVLSHELRSPLNPILGWAQLLQTRLPDAATLARGLQTIERNAKLQTQLIADLLDVSRILQSKLTLEMAPVNLKDTIASALETVQLAAATKAIDIHTQFDLATVEVLGDAGRLQQVVWNLLANAVKFTPSGGRVEIHLAIGGEAAVPQAQITVVDTGKGITPEVLPFIFERFRQADSKTTRQFGGLGLGLAIARQLVELHGGTIAAASPGDNQGTTFTVQLPLHHSPAPSAPETTAPPRLPVTLTGVRILVAEDEVDAREMLVLVLEQAGAVVTPVASGAEALATLPHLDLDVLISDIAMPDMDGHMLLRQMRSQAESQGNRPRFKAVALTAYAGEANQQRALAAGFECHLSKPFEPQALVAAIAALLE